MSDSNQPKVETNEAFKQKMFRNYIGYNPERYDYTVTPEEFSQMQNLGSSLYKDALLVALPFALSCGINACALYTTPFVMTLGFFLNAVFAILCLIASVFFGFGWRRNHVELRNLISQIKSKPRMAIAEGGSDNALISPAPAQNSLPAQQSLPPPSTPFSSNAIKQP